MRVRLIGISPKKQPVKAEKGWYQLGGDASMDVSSLLALFGLTASGLSILRNGQHAAPDEKLADTDEIQIFIKSLGG